MLKFLKNLKFKKAKKGLSLLLVVGFSSFVIFLFYNKLKPPEYHQKEAQNLHTKIEEIDKKILIAKLNQKAQNLGIDPPLHHKHPEIIDYSLTILTSRTQFITSGKTFYLPKNTRLIVIKTNDGQKFYQYKKLTLRKAQK